MLYFASTKFRPSAESKRERINGAKKRCSLIGSTARKCSIHRPEDGLERGSVRSHGNSEVFWTPLSRYMPIALYPLEQATGMQMGNRGPNRRSEPKFGREEWFMKTRIVGLLALASLILAFAFIATAPAAPNKANVPATPAASALPATPAAAPAATEKAIEQLEICLKYDKD